METLTDQITEINGWGTRTALVLKTEYRTFRYSFADVRRLVSRVGCFLSSLNIIKGDRVVLQAPNSPAWTITFLACVARGIVVVPLDPQTPRDTVRHIIQETEPKLLLHAAGQETAHTNVKLLALEMLLKEAEASSAEAENAPNIGPDDLVEIVYTSGTTSEPKGVMLTHRNVQSNTSGLSQAFPELKGGGLLSLLPLCHVFEQVIGMWLPLARGASITYIDSLKPQAIFRAFSEEKISMMVVVPRILEMLRRGILHEAEAGGKLRSLQSALALASHAPDPIKHILFRPIHRRFPSTFQYFVVGGARLDPGLEDFWTHLGFHLLQGYGLTETGPVIACNTPRAHKARTVGRVLSNEKIRIAPDHEILVQGPNVFPGYYQHQDKSDQAFQDGWFKTGDLGFVDKQGYLHFQGRKKDIIVTADGLNVYTEDVESTLNKLPGVKDSCVLAKDVEGSDEVHAVLLLTEDAPPVEEIRRQANETLAPHQAIRHITVWPEADFPRTLTFKIQKFKVKETLEAQDTASLAQAVDKTQSLASIIADLAHRARESIRSEHQLGADLGLSSIDRVELVTRIEQIFHTDLDEAKITAETTVQALEEQIQGAGVTEREIPFRPWTCWWPIRLLRILVTEGIFLPLLQSFCPVSARGTEHLQGLKGPVIFASNHTSHLDVCAIYCALPSRIRRRICPAAWQEFFDVKGLAWHQKLHIWWLYNLTTVFFNIFLFPITRGYRASIRYSGHLLDKGWNVLFFPEGARTLTGELGPFKEGIGMLASNLQVPVVPIRIRGLFEVLPASKDWPGRGHATITFGKAMIFEKETDYGRITSAVENAVRNL